MGAGLLERPLPQPVPPHVASLPGTSAASQSRPVALAGSAVPAYPLALRLFSLPKLSVCFA